MAADKDSLEDDGTIAPAHEPPGAVPHVSVPVIEPVTGPPPEVAPKDNPAPGVIAQDHLVPAFPSDSRAELNTVILGLGPRTHGSATSDHDSVIDAARAVATFDDVNHVDEWVLGPSPRMTPEGGRRTRIEMPMEAAESPVARTIEDFILPAIDGHLLPPSSLQDAQPTHPPDPERAPLLVRLGIEPDADAAPNTAELLTGAEMPTVAAVEQIRARVAADDLEPACAQAEVMAADMTITAVVSGTTVSDSQIEPVAALQPQPQPQLLPPAPPLPPSPLLTEAPAASLSRWPRERSPVQARAPEPIRAFTQPPVHRALLQPDVEVPLTTRPEPFETKLPPPQPAPVAAPPRHWVRRAGVFAVRALAVYAALLMGLVVLFRFVDPPGSALIAIRWMSGTEIQRSWVPVADMSPQLVRAVIVSEDWSFCSHNGIDLEAIEQAIEKAGDGIPRGASTISMQVAKNVFLWPSKSYVRKAIEVPLTLMMELIWPKRRILEVYLNVAEWGPGIFGAEAAAQHHFQKSASSLTAREAAQLAASLPNPFRRDAGDPGPQTARKASIIQARMRIAGPAADCVLQPLGGSTTKQRSD